MNWGSRNILGLSLGDRTIQCAQIVTSGSKPVVERLATYEMPAGVGFDKPDALGQSFKDFLQTHRFSAKHAIVGVPLRWMVTHTVDVPPLDGTSARALLRLHCERLSTDDELSMVYDCVGEPGGSGPTQVLLAGLLGKQLANVRAMAESAGLSVLAVTSTSLVISRIINLRGDATMLVLSDHGTELLAGHESAVPSVRHLRVIPDANNPGSAIWDSELKRAYTLAGHSGSSSGRLLMIDAVGLTQSDQSRIGRVLGDGDWRTANVNELSVTVQPESMNGSAGKVRSEMFIPAIALGVAGKMSAGLPVNFTKSRLAAPPVRRFGRTQMIAMTVGVAVVIGLIALYATMLSREKHVMELTAIAKNRQPEFEASKKNIAQFTYGRQYFETRTPVLDCLKQITLTFRDGEPIWITNFTLKDTGKGTLQGKSTDQRVILAVLDRLRNNKIFSDVQLQDMRDSSGRDRETIFSIKLTYLGKSGS